MADTAMSEQSRRPSVGQVSPGNFVFPAFDTSYYPDPATFSCYQNEEFDNLPLQYPEDSSPTGSSESSGPSNESILANLEELIQARFSEIHASNIFYGQQNGGCPTISSLEPAFEDPRTSYPPHIFLNPLQNDQETGQEWFGHSSSPVPPLLPGKMLEAHHALRTIMETPRSSPHSQRQTLGLDISPSHYILPLADIANVTAHSPRTPFDQALDIFYNLGSNFSPVVHHSSSPSPIARSEAPQFAPQPSPIASEGPTGEMRFSPFPEANTANETPTRTTPAKSDRLSSSPLTPVDEPPAALPPKYKSRYTTAPLKRKTDDPDGDYIGAPVEVKRVRCSIRQLLQATRVEAESDDVPLPDISPIPSPAPVQQGSKRASYIQPPTQEAEAPDASKKRLSVTRSAALPPSGPSSAPVSVSVSSTPSPQGSLTFTSRSFNPAMFEVSSAFPLFYRRYPTSSYYKAAHSESPLSLFSMNNPGGTYNPPKSVFDLYTPRFVKGKGRDKVGLCPICIESVERGGEKKQLWLAMKFSAYKCYHMQYMHGISAASSLPFVPPLAFRVSKRPRALKTEKTEIKEGKCHQCHKWIPVEGVKDMEVKVKEIFWWKHAAACHSPTALKQTIGEQALEDVFERDDVHQALKEIEVEMEADVDPGSSQ